MSRVVIAGASMGGLRAAEQLRSTGFTGEIIVIGDEPHMPYNRPPLSKEALAGESDFAELAFRMRDSITDVQWRLGSGVESADLAGRSVTLANGDALSYDGLVIATGLHAVRLNLPGAHDARHVVRTLDDALGLRAALVPGAHVVVIGAGFIGCEVAATARKLGCETTIVAPETVPMQRPLGADLGAELQRRHEARGVTFHLGRIPVGYEAGNVVLDDGTELPADVVVEAVGCRPNVAWLQGNGLDLSDGVLCDNHLRVAPNIVAVGDIARFANPLFDDIPRRVEHWSIPTDTARRAARTLVAELAGTALEDKPFAPMPAFWSDQYELRIQSFGAPGLGGDDIRVLEGDPSGEVIVGYHHSDVLVGVVALDMTARAMQYRATIMAGAAGRSSEPSLR